MAKKNAIKKLSAGHGLNQYMSPRESLGFIVREVYRAVSRSLQARIAREGVSIGMWFVLRMLWEKDGLTQRELGQRVGINGPTMVTALNAMERAGFVERVPNRTDRRKTNIFLTQRGRELKQKLWPMAAEVLEIAFKGINRQQLRLVRESLSRMRTNLEADAEYRRAQGGKLTDQ